MSTFEQNQGAELNPQNSESSRFSSTLRKTAAPLLLGALGGLLAPMFNSSEREETKNLISEVFGESIGNEVGKQLPLEVIQHKEELIQAAIQALLKRTELNQGLETALGEMAAQWHSKSAEMQRDMLNPVVNLTTPYSSGSAVVVSSQALPDGSGYETYMLTNWHVVSEDLQLDLLDLQGIILQESALPVIAKIGRTNIENYPNDDIVYMSVIASDKTLDLALLKGITAKQASSVSLASLDEANALQPFDLVFAVGCPLGNDPIPTLGIVSEIAAEGNSGEYILSSSPITYGNSGGGLFLAYNHKLIGIPTAVQIESTPYGPQVANYMCFSIPAAEIHKFLVKSGFSIDQTGAVRRGIVVELTASLDPSAETGK